MTKYIGLPTGWLRRHPKSPSKRRRRIVKRQAIKQSVEGANTQRTFDRATAEFVKRSGHRKRRRARAQAEKAARKEEL